MGSSKKQKTGTKYDYGFAMVPLRQHDSLLEMEMNDKTVWTGQKKHGRISVNKKNAFGGDEREGGIVGDFDVQDGRLDQPINDYLAAAKTTLTSAMRGCVSIIARRPYLSANTARLPKIRTKHAITKSISRGWNEVDEIVKPPEQRNGDMYFLTFENSTVADSASLGHAKAGAAAFVRGLKGSTNSVSVYSAKRLLDEGSIVLTPFSITRYDCDDTDYEDIALHIEAINTSGDLGGANPIDVSAATDFFGTESAGLSFSGTLLGGDESQDSNRSKAQRHVFILAANGSSAQAETAQTVIDGLPSNTLVTLVKLQRVGGGYEDNADVAALDNTDISGVQKPLTDDQARRAIDASIGDFFDMNPAHIIRCLWTDPMRGGVVPEEDIGDSFDGFADLCIEEGLGLSPKFRGIDNADADRLDVERHCDVMSYRSNTTGKIEVVPIRADYNVNELITLDSSVITDWSGLSRPRKSEVPNQLTVTYTRRDGKSGSVTRTNVAGVRRAGRVIKAQPIAYPSCTRLDLAVQLCLRDLRTVTSDILSGTIPLTYLPQGVEVGTPVILNEPRVGINNVVVRVSETRIGKHDDSTATLTVSEDKYETAQSSTLVEEEISNQRLAVPVLHRLVEEASYFQGVLELGQDVVDEQLTSEPDLGRLFATGAKGNGDQLDATLATSPDGTTWEDEGLVDFEPYGTLINDLSKDASATTFLVDYNITQDEIEAGQLARLGNEIIRIDDMVDQGDGTVLVTAGRGCLDGPPEAHTAGDAFVMSSVIQPLEDDYIAGQAVQVKMLSRTGEDAQTLSEAETDTLTFTSRAVRPYPPGKLQIGGLYVLGAGAQTGTITATWSHRDRTIQTTPAVDDFTASNIGPESGTTYNMHVEGFDPDGVSVGDMVNTNIGAVTTYDLDLTTGVPAGSFELVMTVSSVRDGYESWKSPSILIPITDPGYGNGYGYRYGE